MKKNKLKNLINIPELIEISGLIFVFELILNLSVASIAVGNGNVSGKDIVISIILLILLSVALSLTIEMIRSEKKEESEPLLVVGFFAVSSVFQNSMNLGLLQSLMFVLTLLAFLSKTKKRMLIVFCIMFIQSLFMSNTAVIYLPLMFILIMLTCKGKERTFGVIDILVSSALGLVINKALDLPKKLCTSGTQYPNLNLEKYIIKSTKEIAACIAVVTLTLMYFIAEYIFIKKKKEQFMGRKSGYAVRVVSVIVPMISCMTVELFSYSDTALYISPIFGFIVSALCLEDSMEYEINCKVCEFFRKHNAVYIVALGLIATVVTYNHDWANALYDAVTNYFWM